ncbi:tyrosine-protein phosphatase non-receptor type 18 isoform X1 [Acanthopagrus latus]|uniref:tyrosine-protein phosphatase non-receptor type 18 isoform X1 n=2 Tax=Acanthopagrus latus TaxID=8177 RepID=UPI00187CE140|nr:tyrosine-protein phosphatase non-receptor type 18 isoform X1 [Acanthopagrus latus]XP_036959214.1 tyrosine-protein phosphatase non-receptor type 18 isoform X1 [Acanthopagrus latus]
MELLPSLLSSLRTVDPGTVDQEYNAVRSQTLMLKRDLGLTTEAGALKENIKKNRYKDILPYDQSRVVLSLLTTDNDNDYINASFIKGASADRSYIASQGPLSSTVTDFWRMIWQHDVKVIVMACREVEMGKKKCECYWSPVHQSAAFGPFTVYTQAETRPNEDLVVRALTVSYQQVTRSLVQYQFLSWPDHDIPYEAAGVLDLLEKARNSQGTQTSPLLIHCSAGCGRTGVICAIDYIHDLLVTKQLTGDFSIMSIVVELRRQRPSAVQTKDQYQFIFTAVAFMLEQALQASSQPLYSNQPELTKKPTRTPASSTKRQSQQTDMSDTYAVVNKPKQPHPPPTGPAYTTVATPRTNSGSRTLPASHHYDNDSAGAPIYSTVKPRARSSAPPIYDIAVPANQRQGEGPLALSNNGEYQLLPAERLSQTDDDYEDFSTSVSDMTNLCSPGGIGFNCRIQKPRGPRDPPAEWSRLER